MIDLNLIYTFVEVAKKKSIYLAARRLDITQSAVSQRIKALEDQIGKSLFLRKAGMELNSAGEELFFVCKEYIRNASEIDNWVKFQKGYVGGDISIMTTYGPVSYIFPDFLKDFLSEHEDIRIGVKSVESSPAVEDSVLKGEADIGLIVGPCQRPSLKVQTIIKNNPVLMVCSPSYFLARKKFSKADLHKARLLVHSHKSSRTLREIFKQIGVPFYKFENMLRLPDMETCKVHALKGLGVAFIAKIYINEELKTGKLVSLPNFELRRPMNLISRNDKNESLPIKIFKDAFVEYCHELDARWF
jgi:DNA-binding transcriptional LysR family regulator